MDPQQKEKEIKQKKLEYLHNLLLSKWQLIWTREHDLHILKKFDVPMVRRLNLEGKTPSNVLMQMDKIIETNELTFTKEIERSHREIEELDKLIEQMENEQETRKDS